MKLVKRNFNREFKLQVCHEVESRLKTQAQASREYMIGSNLISQWIKQYRQDPVNCFAGSRSTQSGTNNESIRVKQLETALGRATLEIQILKEANTLLKKIQLEQRRFTK